MNSGLTSYAELQVTTNFSFLRGASHPGELVLAAKLLGMAAIGITDRNSLAGVVRAHRALREVEGGIQLVIGARLDFADAPSVLCYPTDRAAYGRLTQLLTDGKRRTVKGECLLYLDDLLLHGDGQQIVALPVDGGRADRPDQDFVDHLKRLRRRFDGALYLAAHHLYRGDDAERLLALGDLADDLGLPLLATNDVHAHAPERRPLQDVLSCLREGCTLHEAGTRLHANAERHLKSPAEMARLFRLRPDAIANTLKLAKACTFSLTELRYEYPAEPVPEGRTPQQELERLVAVRAARRYGDRVPEKVRGLLDAELALVAKLDYARYFLTVYDLVRFAEEKSILCQGRGSAANSALCYVLGITAVDPEKVELLFERFLSEERKEPPDIDVDFEHERREEVIQYIYEKYKRHRAGLVATVITYRPKSAVRDVGKALGLSPDLLSALAGTLWGWGRQGIREDHIREAGLDPEEPTLRRTIALAIELLGFPRHLSQHTGGFVITRGPLSEVVPIENAAMEDRTVIEWDKDDLDELGMLKIDVLALGMLTCIRKGLHLLKQEYGLDYAMYGLPPEDPAVYEMLGRADSVGVFQVESRAQMTMLPRLKPKTFYDLVIEVAIVRPGPIQGDMVHPYLRRRAGKEKAEYPKPELEKVLERTLGVPLFQEQAMKIAMVAAGFSAAQADRLRRAMATFRHSGTIGTLQQELIDGMVSRGYERDFAERCYRQIEGFGDYGFPESHAASFALLVYVSAWLKCHYPEVFACAILNSQPMGFYAPAQLVRDARDHRVDVRPVDVNHSGWDCTLEATGGPRRALRLGFRQIKGFKEPAAEKLVAARHRPFQSVRDLWTRSGLDLQSIEVLAKADAFGSLGLDRRSVLWGVRGLGGAPLPLFAAAEKAPEATPEESAEREPPVAFPAMPMGEQVSEDYRHLRLSLKQHPLALLRQGLAEDGYVPAGRLRQLRSGIAVRVAGLVLIRQQPGTSSGVIFVTLEDETGIANLVVWPRVFEAYRRTLLGSEMMGVAGRVQSADDVTHVVAERLVDLSDRVRSLAGGVPAGEGRALPTSRDFR